MLFKELAKALFDLNEQTSRLAMTEQLANLLKTVQPDEAYHISYLVLGTLKAPYKKNNQFNLAEKSVKKVIAQLLNLSISDIDAIVQKGGDLGFALLSTNWPYQDQNLNIHDVFEELSKIQEISGVGAQEYRGEILSNLLKKVDALSAAFIVRMVLGIMRLGFSDMTFIDALSWMLVGNKSLRSRIEHAYNICADLGFITRELKEDGIDALNSIHIKLGVPIRPASAERLATSQAIIDKIGPCLAQPKLDGFRVQVHVEKSDKDHFWFFSRNMQDMSDMFPEIKESLASLPINTVILEGEAIVYDEVTESFLPFQQTVKRKRKHDIESVAQDLPLRFYIFDILYLNGESLLSKTHIERRKILEKIINNYNKNILSKSEEVSKVQFEHNKQNSKDKVKLESEVKTKSNIASNSDGNFESNKQKEKSKVLHLIDEKFCQNANDLQKYFDEQVDKGLEGLVVKRPDGIYRPGKRDFNWIKLKRQQIGHLSDSIDAVVLGYYYGGGKRAGFGIGAYLAGIFNPAIDKYETIARIGTGLSDIEWKELKEKADHYKTNEKPINVLCVPELTPDVWVIPKIVTILVADEITKSPLHTAARGLVGTENEGLALRFPRFEGYSLDKESTQATSTEEVMRLYQIQYQPSKK